jgi:tetratricopeptide (TPR) repeat protein
MGRSTGLVLAVLSTFAPVLHAQDTCDARRAQALVAEGLAAPTVDEAVALFDEAIDVARHAVTVGPENADAHYALALALGARLEHHGMRTKARMAGEVVREAKRALELDPRHAGAHHVLGRVYAGVMRLSGVSRFIAKHVLGASALDGITWESAEEHFLAARALEPTNPRHAMELGALYLDSGHPEEARAVLEELLAAPPAHADDDAAWARARTLLARATPGGS